MKAVGTRVYSKNQTFTKPSGVVEVEIENETIPLQLPSDYTPENMRTMELFKEGTEPTDISIRYQKLEAPTNGNYTFDGKTIKLTWTGINTPEAINTTYLQEYFNTYYGNVANKYYENRISYNNTYIGTLGYQIYKKESNGTLTYLGTTNTTNYSIIPSTTDNGSITYVIKSAYSIFTSNMSDGLEIKVNINIDSNVDDIVGGNEDNNDNNNNKPIEKPTPGLE